MHRLQGRIRGFGSASDTQGMGPSGGSSGGFGKKMGFGNSSKYDAPAALSSAVCLTFGRIILALIFRVVGNVQLQIQDLLCLLLVCFKGAADCYWTKLIVGK